MAKRANATMPKMAVWTSPRLTWVPPRMAGRARIGRASSPPTASNEAALSPAVVRAGSMPEVESIPNCAAAPAASPPGRTLVTVLPASPAVTTANQLLVPRQSRWSPKVQTKLATSATTMPANHHGLSLVRRGQDAKTRASSGNTT